MKQPAYCQVICCNQSKDPHANDCLIKLHLAAGGWKGCVYHPMAAAPCQQNNPHLQGGCQCRTHPAGSWVTRQRVEGR